MDDIFDESCGWIELEIERNVVNTMSRLGRSIAETMFHLAVKMSKCNRKIEISGHEERSSIFDFAFSFNFEWNYFLENAKSLDKFRVDALKVSKFYYF